MQITIHQRRQINQVLTFVSIGLATGLLYVYLEGTLNERHSAINAVTTGFILSIILAIYELVIFRRQKRHVRFITLFMSRMLVYMAAAISVPWLVLAISHMKRFDLTFQEAIGGKEFQQYIEEGGLVVIAIYAFIIMAAVNFWRQMSRKLGQGMLLAYITGRYHQPEVQQGIIMFIDVIGSKMIIERLGAKRFHQFLNNLIFDITVPIVSHSGTILHYVEDEVVVNWSMKKGLTKHNCVRTFFSIKHTLEGLHEEYYHKYGFVPDIRAAVHCGTLVKTEMGLIKKEISVMGDVLNTTSRILDECNKNRIELLVSSDLLDKLELPSFYQPEHYSDIALKGKHKRTSLYTIKRSVYASG